MFILNSAFNLILMEEEMSEIGILCASSGQYCSEQVSLWLYK